MAKIVKFYRGLRESYSAINHADGIYFATDTQKIIMNNVEYGGTDYTLSAQLKAVEDHLKANENEIVTSIEAVTDESGNLSLQFTDLGGKTVSLVNLASATTDGFMSKTDKSKLDSLSAKYNSNMDDSLATVSAHGGIPAGTTAATLKQKTWAEIMDDILFPTIQPTAVAPSASLSLKNTTTTPTVQEVGTTGSSVPTESSFNKSFSKGSIKIANTVKQDRAGEQTNAWIYVNGSSVAKTLPTVIPDGKITYNYRVEHATGPTPLDSKGNTATSLTALAAGHVDSSAVTVYGVYPYFTNAANNASFAKLALTTNTTLSAIKFAAEGPNKHAFKLPAKYTLTKVEMLNTLSGKYESFGTDKWTTSSETINVQGTDVAYTVYTRNDSGFNGESTFNITFTK